MLQLTGCVVDLQRRLVLSADGTVALTTREAALLAYLAERSPQGVPREETLREVWGYHHNVLSRALDSTVSRLRTKIEVDPACPDHLITEHGTGHRLVLEREAPAALPGRERPLLTLSIGSVDLSTGQVLGPDHSAMLCSQELALLRELMQAKGQGVGRIELERKVWGNVLQNTNRLRNLIYRLRSKIERDPAEPVHLLSMRGRGYRLELPEVAPASGRATVLAIDISEQLDAHGLDESESAAQDLWSWALAQGGYPTGLSCGQVCLVFSEPEPALEAARRLAEIQPLARMGLCTGEVRRIVHPLSGRFEYLGAPVIRALAQCAPRVIPSAGGASGFAWPQDPVQTQAAG